MRLIGMLDSPYVRRVAIGLKVMGVPFAHEPISVFRQYDAFAAINPVVKAPTVVTDEGIVLMESSLILAYAHSLVPAARHLQPQEPALLARCLRLTGLALAACEKAVQIVYEHNLRPTEKQHAPWIERVTGQMHAAFGALEAEIAPGAQWIAGDRLLDADITAAVAWRFTRFVLPDAVLPRDFPRLAALSERAEALPVFRATPID